MHVVKCYNCYNFNNTHDLVLFPVSDILHDCAIHLLTSLSTLAQHIYISCQKGRASVECLRLSQAKSGALWTNDRTALIPIGPGVMIGDSLCFTDYAHVQ